MKYIYVGGGQHFPNLPAADLDDHDLTREQLFLLDDGVKAGIYEQEFVIEARKKLAEDAEAELAAKAKEEIATAEEFTKDAAQIEKHMAETTAAALALAGDVIAGNLPDET